MSYWFVQRILAGWTFETLVYLLSFFISVEFSFLHVVRLLIYVYEIETETHRICYRKKYQDLCGRYTKVVASRRKEAPAAPTTSERFLSQTQETTEN